MQLIGDISDRQAINLLSYLRDTRTDEQETEKLVVEENGNEFSLTYDQPYDVSEICTVEQLFERAQRNPDDYIEEKLVLNRWADNFQIKFQGRPKVIPNSVFPTIRPVEATHSFPEPEGFTTRVAGALIVPDPQIGYRRDLKTGKLHPFHDRRAMQAVLYAAQTLQPEVVVFVGDWLDLAEWSDKFVRSPEYSETTQPALEEGHWWLARFRRAVPHAKMAFIQGNHEERIERAINLHMRAAFNLTPAAQVDHPPMLNLRYLLGLDSLHIQYVDGYPNGRFWLNKGTVVFHGEGSAKLDKALASSNVNLIQGHGHRLQLISRIDKYARPRKMLQGLMAGTLCKLDGSVPAGTSEVEWQQGFGTVWFEPEGFEAALHAHPILDGSIFIGGSRWEADEEAVIVERIRKDIPDWNF